MSKIEHSDDWRPDIEALAESLGEWGIRRALRFEHYRPYGAQRTFHALGQQARERLLMAGNQVGKTTCGAAELAVHLSGNYPSWWTGHRFVRPIAAWAAGVSSEATAAAIQTHLLGGTPTRAGLLPERLVVGRVVRSGQVLEGLEVEHASGQGNSLLTFKSYAQGRESWQGASLDLVWFDEEPGFDIYMEGLSRTNATMGIVYTTFTPLKGHSRVVERFLKDVSKNRGLVQIGLDDAEHLSPTQREKILESYPLYEREARAKGLPTVGSGRVFPLDDRLLRVTPFDLPDHWPRLAAIDFGWDHPTAAIEMAWDRDQDVIYVTRAYRVREQTPRKHCERLREWGQGLPWAWPHDGLVHEKGTGEALADQYRRHGLAMLPQRVTFEDGSNAVEPGISQMLERMETGRFKVFASLGDWFEEFSLYHRKAGRIHKVRDDLMSATRYALMGLRYAKAPERWSHRAKSENRDDRGHPYNPLQWGETEAV